MSVVLLCLFLRIVKNEGSFGQKIVNLAICSEMDRKLRVSGQNYFFFEDSLIKKKSP